MSEINPMRGQLRHLLLSALSNEPLHGYGIAKKISEMTCGYWKPTSGALYPALEDLISEKLIRIKSAQQGGRRKKVYEITFAGRQSLAESSRGIEGMEKRFLEAVRGSKALSGLSHDQILDLFRVLKEMVFEDMPEHRATMLEFMFLLKGGRISTREMKEFKSSLKGFLGNVARINKRKLKELQ